MMFRFNYTSWKWQFLGKNISQGSVATHLRCDGIFNNHFTTNCSGLTEYLEAPFDTPDGDDVGSEYDGGISSSIAATTAVGITEMENNYGSPKYIKSRL